jgi:hypothetical protein
LKGHFLSPRPNPNRPIRNLFIAVRRWGGVVSQVVAALKETGVAFETFDILSDEAIRQGLKEYSNWPTYPQLYVNR